MAPMLYTLYGFAIFFFIFWCAMWLLHLVAIFYGKYRLHQKVTPTDTESPYPGVSIIKPLMGVDPNLFSNLETFFTMTYPKYEILFCVEDDTDSAIMLVRSLMEKYPKVDAKLFVGAGAVGVNPKINNMNKAYNAVSYEFVLISDSGIRRFAASLLCRACEQDDETVKHILCDCPNLKDVRLRDLGNDWPTIDGIRDTPLDYILIFVKEDTLQDMMRYMSENTALVHQMPFTSDRDGFAGTLEKIYFGTAQSRMYLAADFINVNCHTGMSALIRKSVLDEEGGLKTFGCYLAEDFFMAKALKDKGWKMRICSQPALQNSGICDVNSFQARLTRWAKLRVAMLPLIVIMEPLSECMVIGLGAAWAVNVLFKWDVLGFYLIHILMWFICDWILLSIVQNGSLPFNKFDFVVAWLFRECSGPYLFLHAIFDPEIRWRSRIYKLAWGGVAQEIKPRIKF